jgi:hypothetical protein
VALLILYSVVIKNKDGSVYRLNGPNPIMKSQSSWSGYNKHNFKLGKKEIYEVPSEKEKINYFKEEKIIDDFIADDVKQEEVVVKEEIVVKEEVKVNRETSVDEDVVFVEAYILPCYTRTAEDDLYGERITRNKFGEKLKTKIVPLEYSVNSATFWHNVKFEEGTIIYPSNNHKTWWVVQSVSDYKNGYMLKCMPSSINPKFN